MVQQSSLSANSAPLDPSDYYDFDKYEGVDYKGDISSCPVHPLLRRHEEAPEGSDPLPGEAWMTKISIHFPVLELVRATVPDVDYPVPHFDDALQTVRCHDQFKTRPCIAIGRQRFQRGEDLMSYACATFGGAAVEDLRHLTQRFIVGIYTGPEHATSKSTHIHSSPQWTAPDDKPAYALSIPFASEFRPQDSFIMFPRDEWPDSTLPRLQIWKQRLYRFDEEAMDDMQAHYLQARRQWEHQVRSRDRGAAIQEVWDICVRRADLHSSRLLTNFARDRLRSRASSRCSGKTHTSSRSRTGCVCSQRCCQSCANY